MRELRSNWDRERERERERRDLRKVWEEHGCLLFYLSEKRGNFFSIENITHDQTGYNRCAVVSISQRATVYSASDAKDRKGKKTVACGFGFVCSRNLLTSFLSVECATEGDHRELPSCLHAIEVIPLPQRLQQECASAANLPTKPGTNIRRAVWNATVYDGGRTWCGMLSALTGV
jgi:hypothetical protein